MQQQQVASIAFVSSVRDRGVAVAPWAHLLQAANPAATWILIAATVAGAAAHRKQAPASLVTQSAHTAQKKLVPEMVRRLMQVRINPAPARATAAVSHQTGSAGISSKGAACWEPAGWSGKWQHLTSCRQKWQHCL